MSKLTACIPRDTIDRIQIYINTDKKALASIKAETGADYIINGGLFDMTKFIPYCHLRAAGEVLAKDPYTYYGYAWNSASDFDMTIVPAPAKNNYICCTALIDKHDGKLIYTAAQGGKRGRTAVGTKGASVCLHVSGDGTEDDMTPEELRDYLTGQNWDSAVMLDSGGSSQCDFAGQKITSERVVHNLILIYLKGGNNTKKVCLDPGHGVETAGKCSPDKTYYEHEFNLDMATRMKAILERYGVVVTMTRTDEHDVTLASRVAIANAITDLDLFLSVHTDAANDNGWSAAQGLTAFTSAEGDTAKRNIAAEAMIARFAEAGITLRNPPLKHKAYYVLRNTVAPAVLVEHGFHTSKAEVALLKDMSYRDELAEAECKGILDYLGIAWAEEASELGQAVDKLASAGIVTDSAYWKAGKYSTENVQQLIKNMAAAMK